jgi:hypothetical protein
VSAAVPVMIVICAALWLNSVRALTVVAKGELPSSTVYVLADVLNEESSVMEPLPDQLKVPFMPSAGRRVIPAVSEFPASASRLQDGR